MSRNIVIGDIHGCAKTLRSLVEESLAVNKSDHLFLLGDYVNKGPDSKGVIDYILDLKRAGHHVECLRGNHDQLMLDAWKDNQYFEEWISRGGNTTLQSFQCRTLSDVPMTYYSFLSTTSFFVDTVDHFLVHAGFNFGNSNIFDDLEAMLVVREMNVDMAKTEGKKIVHGHVPVTLEGLKQNLKTDWKEISIDTGCVYTDQEGKGYLSAMILEKEEIVFIKNKE